MLHKLIIIFQLIIEMIISGSLLYFSAMWTFPTCMINLMLFIPGIFVMAHAHDKLIKLIDDDNK